MQAFSKAMFMPVLILPIAGLLIAVGNVFTNARLIEILPFLDNPVTKGFGTILSGALVAILNNLGLIFCAGIAVGLAKKKKGGSRIYCHAGISGIYQCHEQIYGSSRYFS